MGYVSHSTHGRAAMTDTATELEDDKGRAPMPPYVAYSSVNTLFASLKANGMPGRIDRSVLRSFSNQVGTQMIGALKFLKLINGDQRPTDKFRELVRAHDTPKWDQHMSDVLHGAYPAIFELKLESASPSEFNETFSEAYGPEGGTLRKCVTFFVAAAQSAKIPISNYILSNRKPRTVAAKKRAPKAETIARANGTGGGTGAGGPEYHQNPQKPSEMLLRHLKDMEPPEQEAAWVLMKYFAVKNL
jgi:hypothetical protein